MQRTEYRSVSERPKPGPLGAGVWRAEEREMARNAYETAPGVCLAPPLPPPGPAPPRPEPEAGAVRLRPPPAPPGMPGAGSPEWSRMLEEFAQHARKALATKPAALDPAATTMVVEGRPVQATLRVVVRSLEVILRGGGSGSHLGRAGNPRERGPRPATPAGV